ncbi:MAG: FAD-binding oxidoreductase [Chitinivibrionales bacterium]|nr:FAD-binding oxidoreductase [Chitinivibrionales bacterium]
MSELKRALFSAFPTDQISDDPAVVAAYAADTALLPGYATEPSFVVLIKSTDEAVHLLQIANRYRTPVTPMSRGSNIGGISIPSHGGIVADLRHMNKIIEINTDAAYALIEPGVTFHQLCHALNKEGFVCHLPTAAGGSSALANYLMRPSGNLTSRWDPDPLLALEVVTPNKGVIRTGSAAFDGAGWRSRYLCIPDLTGLFGCAYGTFGIVTKAAIKIFDKGEKQSLLLAGFDSFAPSVEFMKRIVRRKVAESVTFWTWGWNLFHEMLLSKEKQIDPAMLKDDQKNPPAGIPFGIASVRLAGYADIVDAQEKRCRQLTQELGGSIIENETARDLYPGSYKYLHSNYVDSIHPKPGEESQIRAGMHLSGCLISAEPSQVINVENHMWEIARREFKPPYFFRSLPYADAREFFFAFVVYITGSLEEQKDYIRHLKSIYQNLYRDLRLKYGAVMFRFRKDPTLLPSTGQYGVLLRDIKMNLDPHNIMNPGMLLF